PGTGRCGAEWSTRAWGEQWQHSCQPLAEQQLGVALDDVVGNLADPLVSQAVVKLLGAVIERGDTEEDKPSARRLPLGEGKQLRSNAFSPGALRDGDGGDVSRPGAAVRMDKDKPHGLVGLMYHKQFAPGAAKDGAALLDLAAQGDPGLASRHQLRTPLEFGFLRWRNREGWRDVLGGHGRRL